MTVLLALLGIQIVGAIIWYFGTAARRFERENMPPLPSGSLERGLQ